MDSGPVEMEFPLDSDTVQRILCSVAQKTGLSVTFSQGSKPVIHVHVHQAIGDHMGDKYSDQSTGPTGAKSFGDQARAKSIGDVSQTLGAQETEEVAKLFERLVAIMAGVQVLDREPLEGASQSTQEGMLEARAEKPDQGIIRRSWEKSKSWITMAIGAGLFATEKAEEIKMIIKRLQEILG